MTTPTVPERGHWARRIGLAVITAATATITILRARNLRKRRTTECGNNTHTECAKR